MRGQLLAEIRNVLGNAISPNLTLQSKGYDLYEAYVFSLVVRAAQRAGANVRYESRVGSAPTTFVFRTSPGEIASGNYSHAVLSFDMKPSVLPRYSSVVLAAECKFYESSGVGVALGRAFMGLNKDFGSRPNFFVISRESIRVKALLAHHKQHWATSIVPDSAVSLNRLIGSFETVFENFKAKR